MRCRPAVIKEILFRAAERIRQPLTLVANHAMRAEVAVYQADPGGFRFDIADNEITRRMQEGDLVITSDIRLPLRCLPGVDARSVRAAVPVRYHP